MMSYQDALLSHGVRPFGRGPTTRSLGDKNYLTSRLSSKQVGFFEFTVMVFYTPLAMFLGVDVSSLESSFVVEPTTRH